MRRSVQRSFRFPATGFLFAVFTCCLTLAQAPSGSIVGQVQVTFGSFPNEPVLVTLTTRGATVNSIYADNEGHFGFSNLPGNIYHIVINDKDYLPIEETVVIDPVTPVRVVTIRLTARDKAKTSSADRGSVSGGNRYVTNAASAKNFPEPARKEFQAGVKSDQNHKTEEAIKHYQKAVQIAPDYYPARNNLGIAFLNHRQYAEAEAQFREVIRINATDAAAYFNLGNLNLLTHHFDQAMQWVEKGLGEEPDSAFGHFLKGSLYVRSGSVQQAESALRRSLELDPTMAKAHLELVNLYLQQKRKGDAIAELKVFLKLFPKDALSAQANSVLTRLEGGTTRSD